MSESKEKTLETVRHDPKTSGIAAWAILTNQKPFDTDKAIWPLLSHLFNVTNGKADQIKFEIVTDTIASMRKQFKDGTIQVDTAITYRIPLITKEAEFWEYFFSESKEKTIPFLRIETSKEVGLQPTQVFVEMFQKPEDIGKKKRPNREARCSLRDITEFAAICMIDAVTENTPLTRLGDHFPPIIRRASHMKIVDVSLSTQGTDFANLDGWMFKSHGASPQLYWEADDLLAVMDHILPGLQMNGDNHKALCRAIQACANKTTDNFILSVDWTNFLNDIIESISVSIDYTKTNAAQMISPSQALIFYILLKTAGYSIGNDRPLLQKILPGILPTPTRKWGDTAGPIFSGKEKLTKKKADSLVDSWVEILRPSLPITPFTFNTKTAHTCMEIMGNDPAFTTGYFPVSVNITSLNKSVTFDRFPLVSTKTPSSADDLLVYAESTPESKAGVVGGRDVFFKVKGYITQFHRLPTPETADQKAAYFPFCRIFKGERIPMKPSIDEILTWMRNDDLLFDEIIESERKSTSIAVAVPTGDNAVDSTHIVVQQPPQQQPPQQQPPRQQPPQQQPPQQQPPRQQPPQQQPPRQQPPQQQPPQQQPPQQQPPQQQPPPPAAWAIADAEIKAIERANPLKVEFVHPATVSNFDYRQPLPMIYRVASMDPRTKFPVYPGDIFYVLGTPSIRNYPTRGSNSPWSIGARTMLQALPSGITQIAQAKAYASQPLDESLEMTVVLLGVAPFLNRSQWTMPPFSLVYTSPHPGDSSTDDYFGHKRELGAYRIAKYHYAADAGLIVGAAAMRQETRNQLIYSGGLLRGHALKTVRCMDRFSSGDVFVM